MKFEESLTMNFSNAELSSIVYLACMYISGLRIKNNKDQRRSKEDNLIKWCIEIDIKLYLYLQFKSFDETEKNNKNRAQTAAGIIS